MMLQSYGFSLAVMDLGGNGHKVGVAQRRAIGQSVYIDRERGLQLCQRRAWRTAFNDAPQPAGRRPFAGCRHVPGTWRSPYALPVRLVPWSWQPLQDASNNINLEVLCFRSESQSTRNAPSTNPVPRRFGRKTTPISPSKNLACRPQAALGLRGNRKIMPDR